MYKTHIHARVKRRQIIKTEQFLIYCVFEMETLKNIFKKYSNRLDLFRETDQTENFSFVFICSLPTFPFIDHILLVINGSHRVNLFIISYFNLYL